MSNLRLFFASILLCGQALSAPLAGDFKAQHQQAVSSNLAGLHFTIALRDGKRRFHIGDRITLDYTLAADVPGKYLVGGSAKDQSGRSTYEQFVVDRPHDAVDPLSGFFDLYNDLYCAPVTYPHEAGKPLGPSSAVSDSVSLTQYLRFNKPGHYRVYVTTRQVILADSKSIWVRPKGLRPSVDDSSLFRPAPVFGGAPLTSENVVEFEVLAQEKATAREEVEQIVARTRADASHALALADAVRLSEIGTPQARQTAAQLYASNLESYTYYNAAYAAMAAVLTAPTHTEAIKLLRQRLLDPETLPDHELFFALPVLELVAQNPELTDEKIRTGGRVQGDHWRQILVSNILAEYQALMASLDQRSASSRALTVRFLHQNLDSMAHKACSIAIPLPAQDMARLKNMHLDTLAGLPAREQTYDIQSLHSWTQGLSRDQLLPILLKLYDQLAPDQDAGRIAILTGVGRFDPELAGKMFRHRVIDFGWMPELSNYIPQFWFDSFSAPELDDYFAKVFIRAHTDEMERVPPLLARFGTSRSLPEIKRVYEVEGAKWPCPMRAGLLSYFLRVDSAYGVAQTTAALEHFYIESEAQCRQGSLLAAMASLRSLDELETLAGTAISDARPLVAASGVTALGALRARDLPYRLLLNRLHKLREEWPDYQSHLNDQVYKSRWKSGYDRLEDSIVRLLIINTGGQLTLLQREALETCISEECRLKISARLRDSQPVTGRLAQ